jgi:hypothetical protein
MRDVPPYAIGHLDKLNSTSDSSRISLLRERLGHKAYATDKTTNKATDEIINHAAAKRP